MKHTRTITRGNQYDPDGYTIADRNLRAYGSKRDEAPGYSMHGALFLGDDIGPAIRATLSDGLTREITQREDKNAEQLPARQ